MTAPSNLGPEDSAATTETGRLGRYQLLQKLASGGMASVYLARAAGPAGFEKVIALKRIHPHLAQEKSFVDMFLDEARIASRIDHANVCSVFDFGEADGTYYIAMEFLAGEPFAHVAKQMARSAEHLKDPRRAYFVARMIADACEGLHAAHELRSRDGELLNVVHRDISPQNLFLTYDGVVKVVDFGIASAADRLHHTQGSEVKGKFSYMAPEQARGTKGARLDRRADVFALGIVLWEMLSLKRLFRRDTPAETLMALVHDDIVPPSSVRPGLTTDFDAIAMKALARNPDERYLNARELGRDLGKAIGKAGEVMGAVDLAEWLESLAPNAREKSRRQIEGALQGEAQRNSLAPPTEVSGSDIVVIEHSNVHSRTAAARGDDDEPATQARPSLTGLTPPPSQASVPPALPRRMSVPPPPPRAQTPDAAQYGGGYAAQIPGGLPPQGGAYGAQGAPAYGAQGGAYGGQGTGAYAAQSTGGYAAQPAPRGVPAIAYIGGGLALLVGVVGVALAAGMFMGRGDGESGARAGNEPAAQTTASPAPALVAAQPPVAQPPVAQPPVAQPNAPATPPSANPALAGNPTTDGSEGGAAPAGGEGGAALAGNPTTDGSEGGADPGDNSSRRPRGARGQRTPRGGGGSTTTAAPAPAPASGGEGTLIVSTPGGWANVFDRAGRLLGQTPLRTQLPAGNHTLSLRPFGQPPAISVTVTVTAGGTARVNRPVEE